MTAGEHAEVAGLAADDGDARLTWGLVIEVLDVLDRHGYRRGDNQHVGQAIGQLAELARTYEGTGDGGAA
jgi:hypothetical protein